MQRRRERALNARVVPLARYLQGSVFARLAVRVGRLMTPEVAHKTSPLSAAAQISRCRAQYCGPTPRAYFANMHSALQITYRGLPNSEALDENIQKRAQRLARAHPGITACHVTVEQPHQHHQRGNHFRVQILLAVPGAHVVVSRGDTVNPAYEDVYIVIRDAFNAALRQLEERARRPRSQRGARAASALAAELMRRPA